VTELKGTPPDAPLTGLSHVQLLVSDLGASADWYTTALGLDPYQQDLDIGYVALRHRGAKVVFVLTVGTPDSGAAAPPASPVGVGLDHLAFSVPDGDLLHSWADHLTEMGIGHPGVVLENGNPSLQLRDPDGNAIELVAPAHRPAQGPPTADGRSPEVPGPDQGPRYTSH
jgi:catechol-2,3-dioxygenase